MVRAMLLAFDGVGAGQQEEVTSVAVFYFGQLGEALMVTSKISQIYGAARRWREWLTALGGAQHAEAPV